MLYDISPPLQTDTAVFPGDTPLQREVLLDLEQGDHITLSTLRGTVHLGAHVDAESHYVSGGSDIAAEDLSRYLGPCQVLAAVGETALALPAESTIRESRVLIKSGRFPDPTRFSDFPGVAVETVDRLAESGVALLGIDTPSVDSPDSTTLPAHAACGRHGIRILEGLVLSGVPEGRYELIALPLRLVGFDASPVRAVLRTLD